MTCNNSRQHSQDEPSQSASAMEPEVWQITCTSTSIMTFGCAALHILCKPTLHHTMPFPASCPQSNDSATTLPSMVTTSHCRATELQQVCNSASPQPALPYCSDPEFDLSGRQVTGAQYTQCFDVHNTVLGESSVCKPYHSCTTCMCWSKALCSKYASCFADFFGANNWWQVGACWHTYRESQLLAVTRDKLKC